MVGGNLSRKLIPKSTNWLRSFRRQDVLGGFLSWEAKVVNILRDWSICCRGGEKMDHPHSKIPEWGGQGKEERPRKKGREREKSSDVELDLGGGIPPVEYVEI